MTNSRVLAIVQARSSSSRLPGKVLQPILGEPMIIRQLERISRCVEVDDLVVATSVDSSDDALVQVLIANDVLVHRGPLDDVYSRFTSVVSEYEPDHIVRLTADCPLTDPSLIDELVVSHKQSGADYSSNCLQRTYPHGLDAECVTNAAFARLGEFNLTQAEREHVTIGIYSRPAEFLLNSLSQHNDLSSLRWTVDYPDDLEFVRSVYQALYPVNPKFTSEDVIAFLESNPELSRTSEDLPQSS